MRPYEDLGSMWKWSIQLPSGSTFSTALPKVVNNFQDFLKVDIVTGDSDPVYWAVNRAYNHDLFGPEWASQFSLAMLVYYDMGVAYRAADQSPSDFWDYLAQVYDYAPRGSERRHFRGAAGRQALDRLRKWAPNPLNFFDQMPTTYAGVKKTCEDNFSQFGPYFQLKLCDYMDRCLFIPITDYRGLERNLPTEPYKAIRIMFPTVDSSQAFLETCETVKDILAAPTFDRPVGPAEVETSLCGWKTTKFKGNWFGADIVEKHRQLAALGVDGPKFASLLPPIIPGNLFKCDL